MTFYIFLSLKSIFLAYFLLRMPFFSILCLESSIFQDPTQMFSPYLRASSIPQQLSAPFSMVPLHRLHSTRDLCHCVMAFYSHQRDKLSQYLQTLHSVKGNKQTFTPLAAHIYFYVYLNRESTHMTVKERKGSEFQLTTCRMW